MPRYLVVDDDASATRAMSHLLRDDGHEVEAFTVGAEAVGALERGTYDVVVTDLHMPGSDGHDVVRAARKHQGPACVVVVTSEDGGQAAGLIASGACMVTDKPVDLERLTSTIAACRAGGGPAPHGLCPLRTLSRPPGR